MKRRWFLFGYSSKEAHAASSIQQDLFGQLPSGFFECQHHSHLLTFASVTHVPSDYCIAKVDSQGHQASPASSF